MDMVKKFIEENLEKHEIYINDIEVIVDQLLDVYHKHPEHKDILINLSQYKENLKAQKDILQKCWDDKEISEKEVSEIENLVDKNEVFGKNILKFVKKIDSNESKRTNKTSRKRKP